MRNQFLGGKCMNQLSNFFEGSNEEMMGRESWSPEFKILVPPLSLIHSPYSGCVMAWRVMFQGRFFVQPSRLLCWHFDVVFIFFPLHTYLVFVWFSVHYHHTWGVFHKPLSLKWRFSTFHSRTSSFCCHPFFLLEPSKLLQRKFISSPPG